MALEGIDDLDPVQEALLLLVGASRTGILSGELRIQKLGFLYAKSLEDQELDEDFDFVPYDLGPYSENLDSAIDLLGSQGFLTKDSESSVYRVTAKGKKAVELLSKRKANHAKIARNLVESLGSLHPDDLVGVVYELYPEYARKSVILERLKRRTNYDSIVVPRRLPDESQSLVVKSRLGRRLTVRLRGDTVHIEEIDEPITKKI